MFCEEQKKISYQLQTGVSRKCFSCFFFWRIEITGLRTHASKMPQLCFFSFVSSRNAQPAQSWRTLPKAKILSFFFTTPNFPSFLNRFFSVKSNASFFFSWVRPNALPSTSMYIFFMHQIRRINVSFCFSWVKFNVSLFSKNTPPTPFDLSIKKEKSFQCTKIYGCIFFWIFQELRFRTLLTHEVWKKQSLNCFSESMILTPPPREIVFFSSWGGGGGRKNFGVTF